MNRFSCNIFVWEKSDTKRLRMIRNCKQTKKNFSCMRIFVHSILGFDFWQSFAQFSYSAYPAYTGLVWWWWETLTGLLGLVHMWTWEGGGTLKPCGWASVKAIHFSRGSVWGVYMCQLCSCGSNYIPAPLPFVTHSSEWRCLCGVKAGSDEAIPRFLTGTESDKNWQGF